MPVGKSRKHSLTHDAAAGEAEVGSSEALLGSADDPLMEDHLIHLLELGAVGKSAQLLACVQRGLQLAGCRIDELLRPHAVHHDIPVLQPLLEDYV